MVSASKYSATNRVNLFPLREHNMHEMSLAESVLEVITEMSVQQDFQRVAVVTLEIGQLAAVEPEALRFCFDELARGTVAEGARLDIVSIPGIARCLNCEAEMVVDALYGVCTHCGSQQLSLLQGNEMRVKELLV